MEGVTSWGSIFRHSFKYSSHHAWTWNTLAKFCPLLWGHIICRTRWSYHQTYDESWWLRITKVRLNKIINVLQNSVICLRTTTWAKKGRAMFLFCTYCDSYCMLCFKYKCFLDGLLCACIRFYLSYTILIISGYWEHKNFHWTMRNFIMYICDVITRNQLLNIQLVGYFFCRLYTSTLHSEVEENHTVC